MDENKNLNGNKEIEDALKEFEAKSGKEQIKKPSEISGVDYNLNGNTEIAEALKEFESKSNNVVLPKKISKFEKTDEDLNFKGNVKIEDSLKEFEEKYSKEEQQKQVIREPEVPRSSKMVQLVIKYSGGLIKEERYAEYVLFGFAILVFSFSMFIFFGGFKQKNVEPMPAWVLERQKQQIPINP